MGIILLLATKGCIMKKVRLNIPNISCDNCKKSIEKALGDIEGIQAVNVDVPNAYADATYDTADVTLEKIETILGGIGYDVVGKTMMTPGQGV